MDSNTVVSLYPFLYVSAVLVKIVYLYCIIIFLDFFRRQRVSTMTIKELFDFVTDVTITDKNIDEYLDRAMEIACNRAPGEIPDEKVRLYKR